MQPIRIHTRTIVALIALAVFCQPGSGLAAGPDNSEDKRFGQEILEILKDEGEIDEQRYEELKEKEQSEWDTSYTVKYSNGLSAQPQRRQHQAQAGGTHPGRLRHDSAEQRSRDRGPGR